LQQTNFVKQAVLSTGSEYKEKLQNKVTDNFTSTSSK